MPAATRLGDLSQIQADSHGCPMCPHPGVGPAIQGSTDVFINKMPAVRVGDKGIHAACCGTNMWTAKDGSGTVFINGKKAHRKDDRGVSGRGNRRLTHTFEKPSRTGRRGRDCHRERQGLQDDVAHVRHRAAKRVCLFH
jgi:uncharacterized Zn-binding protein involved in type VI secretion